MQVTNVRVSFFREKQPAQFEKSHPAVEFAAALEDGENHEAVARELMTSATKVVYNGLGYDVPPRVAQALASGKVPAELAVEKDTAPAPEEAPLASETAIEKTPKKQGRPVGSKNTAPKKETAKAKRLREEAEAAADTAGAAAQSVAEAAYDDAVPGDEDKPQVSTNPEDRVDPDAVPGDDAVPGEEETPVETPANEAEAIEFTPKDLHTLIMSHVNATPRTLSVANAKQVLANFKVARAQDLTNEQAVEGKGLVEKMVAASAAG